MEKSSKRGKIPQHDWPSIISRYESGETLASIARTYDCSPPAISYIVSRTRARGVAAEEPTPKPEARPLSERQTVNAEALTAVADIAGKGSAHSSLPPRGDTPSAKQIDQPPPVNISNPSAQGWFAGQAAVPRSGRAQGRPEDDHSGDGNGEEPLDAAPTVDNPMVGTRTAPARPPASHSNTSQIGEPRRTLHLSLPQGNGPPAAPGAPPAARNATSSGDTSDVPPLSHPHGQSGYASEPRQSSPFPSSPDSPSAMRGPASAPYQSQKTMEGGAFIDHALRARINDDIAAFLAAFDAALAHDTAESRSGLREATDRLLRAGARTRIELERLEARTPLPPRDGGSRPFSGFRPTR
jgi:hypothetical protein